MKKGVLFVALVISLSLVSSIAAQPASIELDAGQEAGPLPFLFRSGMFAYGAERVYPVYIQEKFFRDHKPGAIEVGTVQFLYASQSFEDLVNRLHAQPEYDAFLKRIEKYGGKVVIAIYSMPRWLSSNPDDTRPVEPGEWLAVWGASPPKDYEQWAEVVQTIVDYYSNQLGLDAWYKVWWEPEGVRWQGTEEEFFELYKYTVIGARRARPDAKIGGPSVAGWHSTFWKNPEDKDQNPMLYNYTQYCATTPVPELGLDRLPIDFLIWHGFHIEPSGGFQKATTEIREWLRKFGYPETTPMLLGEWSTWREFQYPTIFSPERDTEYTASYAMAALVGMAKAGITHHAFTSLVEEKPSQYNGLFGGDFGIFTKFLIIKPVYNAFRTLSYLGEEQVKVEVTDPFLAAIGTRGDEGVTLLVANFIPDGGMLHQAVARLLWEKGYTKEMFTTYGLTRKELEQVVKALQRGNLDVGRLGLPELVKQDLVEVAAYVQQARTQVRALVAVELRFTNLPLDLVRYERYVIDATHSNSYTIRSSIEAALAAGQTPAQINEWPEVALQKVEEKTLRPMGEYRETLDVSPYSVTLIRLLR
ncbi:MAG: hypothetical protein HY347_07770 [candidate division NC10 bacterium]|nr:hypothetical protein [candidate division NC10 bacterium]